MNLCQYQLDFQFLKKELTRQDLLNQIAYLNLKHNFFIIKDFTFYQKITQIINYFL